MLGTFSHDEWRCHHWPEGDEKEKKNSLTLILVYILREQDTPLGLLGKENGIIVGKKNSEGHDNTR